MREIPFDEPVSAFRYRTSLRVSGIVIVGTEEYAKRNVLWVNGGVLKTQKMYFWIIL